MKPKKYLPTLVLFITVLIITCTIFFIDYYIKENKPLVSNEENKPLVSNEENKPLVSDQIIQVETESSQSSHYPPNLIEGTILSIGSSPIEEISVEANLDKMFLGEGVSRKKVKILINKDVKFFLLNIKSGLKKEINVEELKKGDAVLVVIIEDNKNILTKETFTATVIKKVVAPFSKNDT